MWKLKDIKEDGNGQKRLIETVKTYILDKNLNITVARGCILNQPANKMEGNILDTYLDEYSRCNFSMVSIFNDKPSPPFVATDTDPGTGIARVQFLMDLTQEAQKGEASPFYSKMMGAFATQFFATTPEMKQLIFPFTLADTLGRNLILKNEGKTGCILQK